ncbi:MAG: hypothetical protein ACYDB7_11300 [Mycobacteriales bacterium]
MRTRLAVVSAMAALAAAAVPGFAAGGGAPNSGGTGSVACNDGTVTYSPVTIWPPNHQMVTVTINYTDSDGDGSATTENTMLTVGTITDNEIVNGQELPGSGQPNPPQGADWMGTGNTATATDPGTATTTAQVRAERSGTDPGGRVYTIQVSCADMGGTSAESASQTVDLTVTVPHDQGNNG